MLGAKSGLWRAAAVAALFTSGCGSPQAAPADPAIVTTQRLTGNWQLVSFTPEKPLGEPLQGLLDAQLSALSISFTDSTFAASGPGVNTHGRYEITTAIGNEFSGTLYDAVGAPYTISGRFDADRVEFVSTSQRWRGSGELQRIGEP